MNTSIYMKKLIDNLKKNIRERLILFANLFKPVEDIEAAKAKWNRMAKENAKYFVLTNKGESISEEEFRETGKRDVETYFLNDPMIKKYLAERPLPTILEIGCGVGRLSEFLAPNAEFLYGADISEEMISVTKKRLGHVKNADFYATDGLGFPIEDSSVDIIFSALVFQHMPSIEIIRRNIQEIGRVLKPGGLAKIQLRAVPVSKDHWYYGRSVGQNEVEGLVENTPLLILKSELEGFWQKHLWTWLEKEH